MNRRKVCYITGTRADFGLIQSTLQHIRKSRTLDLSLVVTGMHLMRGHGLTVAEIEASIEDPTTIEPAALQEQIANRRLAYDYWFTVIPPDAIVADGTPISEEGPSMAITRTLKGVAASGGCVRGRARIVQTIEEAMQLHTGDILVTRATDPGWTPIFPLVSGIVLEIGGQLSHGAIVAREYAIPAVLNVTSAMQAIQDGQAFTVDGTNGIVTLE